MSCICLVYVLSMCCLLVAYLLCMSCLCVIYIKLCENTKNYKSAYPGSDKVVYGACEQESEEKNFKF